MAVEDMRGQLPVNGEASYSDRPLSGITGATIHYTASPPEASVWSIAAYQTSEAARKQTGNNTPFPGLAYTYAVPLTGTPVKAWDLSKRVWHNSAKVKGIYRNVSNVGVVWIGDDTPTVQQIRGLAEALLDAEKELNANGNPIVFDADNVEGHKDSNKTSCPGKAWPKWKPDLMAALESMRDSSGGDEGDAGWMAPGFAEMYKENRSRMGTPTTPPYSDSLGNVWQDSEKGHAMWNNRQNRNYFMPSDSGSRPFST